MHRLERGRAGRQRRRGDDGDGASEQASQQFPSRKTVIHHLDRRCREGKEEGGMGGGREGRREAGKRESTMGS